MKKELKKSLVLVLELTEQETTWLHNVMQNPFLIEESNEDKKMRELFWTNTLAI